MTDVAAAQYTCATSGRNFKSCSGRHGASVAFHALQQHGLPDFIQHVPAVVRSGAIDAKPDGNVSAQHGADRGDAAREAHVRTRAMGNTGAGAAKKFDFGGVELDAMGVPYVVADPTEVFGVLAGANAEFFKTISDVFDIFCQMGMETDALLTREDRGVAHQLAADGKW